MSSYVTRTEMKPVISDLQSSILVLFVALAFAIILLAFFLKKTDDARKRLRDEIKGNSDAEKIAALEKMDSNFTTLQKQQDEQQKKFFDSLNPKGDG